MNTIHNNGDNDQSLNNDLDELGQAYSKLEQDEPPELLDQAILNSAHRAVEKKPHWMKFGWLHGLTTTAVFVLAFTIILDQRESAPTFKDDIISNSPSVLKNEGELKKQSVDKVDAVNSSTDMASEYRQKSASESAPTLTAPAARSAEVSELRERVQAPQQARRNLRAQGATLGKSEQDDKDLLRAENMYEEAIMDEAESMADAPATAGTDSIQASPTAASEPVSSAMKLRGKMDTSIEQELQAIIDLKNADDESWITELEAFVERYPDYPLPDELKD